MEGRYEAVLVLEVDGPMDGAADAARAVTHDDVELTWEIRQGGETVGMFTDNGGRET